MDEQSLKKLDIVYAQLKQMYDLENASTVSPGNEENMTIETSNSEECESKSALKLVVEEVTKIKTEMQLTRNAFLDAMSTMKQKMDEILSRVIEKIETEITGTIDSNKEEVMKQNDHMVKLEKDVSSHTKSIESAIDKVNSLDRDVEESTRQERKTRRRLIELEAQERKSNLMFFGVPEEEGKSCNEELSLFLKEHLNIDTPCSLQNIKRVGRVKDNGPRPIVTTFTSSLERLKVWEKRYTMMKPFGISEDFPPEIRKARNSLVPRLKELKRQGMQAGIIFPAILVSNGQIVRRIDIADFIV